MYRSKILLKYTHTYIFFNKNNTKQNTNTYISIQRYEIGFKDFKVTIFIARRY